MMFVKFLLSLYITLSLTNSMQLMRQYTFKEASLFDYTSDVKQISVYEGTFIGKLMTFYGQRNNNIINKRFSDSFNNAKELILFYIDINVIVLIFIENDKIKYILSLKNVKKVQKNWAEDLPNIYNNVKQVFYSSFNDGTDKIGIFEPTTMVFHEIFVGKKVRRNKKIFKLQQEVDPDNISVQYFFYKKEVDVLIRENITNLKCSLTLRLNNKRQQKLANDLIITKLKQSKTTKVFYVNLLGNKEIIMGILGVLEKDNMFFHQYKNNFKLFSIIDFLQANEKTLKMFISEQHILFLGTKEYIVKNDINGDKVIIDSILFF